MRLTARLGVFLGTLAMALFGFGVLPAHAWGDSTRCDDARVYDSTRTSTLTGFFAGHNVAVSQRACIASSTSTLGMRFAFHSKPKVSFPSANPFGVLESISLTREPWLYSVSRGGVGNVVERIEYRFSVKQCTIGISGIRVCNDWNMRQISTLLGTRTCVIGGSATCSTTRIW